MYNGSPNLPQPPPGWQITMDNMGRYLYYNPMTQQSSWTPPPGSVYSNQQQQQQPQQQQQQTTPQPSPQFTNNLSNLASSKSSLSSSMLPDGWEESTDAQGRVYYIDHINKRTSWIHPSFSQQLHQQTQQQQQQQQHAPLQSQPQPIVKPITPSVQPSSSPIKQSEIGSGAYYPSMSEFGYNQPKRPAASTTPNSTTPSSSYQQPPQPDYNARPRATSSGPPVQTINNNNNIKSPLRTPSSSLLSQSAPLWDIEKTVPGCSQCYLPFTVIRRRHHCRCCQREFCDNCSQKRIAIPQFNHNDPVRVCLYCFIHTTDHQKTCVSRLIPYISDFHKDPNQQYQALMEIYDFILSHQSNVEVVEQALVGGFRPFLEFIVRTSKENYKSETVALCCQILALASKFEKLTKAINEVEHVNVFFDLMSMTDNSSVSYDCSRILKNILSGIDRRTRAVPIPIPTSAPASGTPPTPTTPATGAPGEVVISKLSTVITRQQVVQIVSLLESPTQSKEFQLECLRLLRVLAHDQETLSLVSQSNVVEVITPILSSNRNDSIKSVLKVLTRLSIFDKKNAEKFYSYGGILFLVELLVKQLHPAITTIAIKLLYSLSKTKLCSSAIVEVEGSIDIVMQLYISNVQLQETILLMLAQITQFETSNVQQLQFTLCNEQFVKTLLQSLRSSSLEPLCLSIFNFIANGSDQTVKEKLRVYGVIDPMLSLINQSGKNHSTPLEILSRLAFNNEKVCENIFEGGGLLVLIDIITAPPPQSQNNSQQSLNTTTTSNIPYHEEVVTEPNVSGEDEKSVEFKRVQYNAVKVIGNLSYSKSIVQEFVHFENGAGVKALVALLNPSVDESLKQITSEALSNLCDNEACSILVLSEGGLTYSMALLSSSNTMVKTNALKLLQKLAIHSPEIKFAISEGTSIRQIVEMLSNQAADLKKCAIYSLAELCKDNAPNRDQAYKYGCLPLLVNSFNTYSSDAKSLVCLLEILSGFAQQSDQYRQVLLSTDLVQSIIEYLFCCSEDDSNKNAPVSQDKEKDNGFIMQSKVYSVLILSLLIREGMNEQIRKIIDSGIILSLVPLLSIKNSYLQEYTLTVLKTITRSSSSDLRETLITSGILLPLSDLVGSTRNESILCDSLHILIELSKSPECGNYLLQTNAVSSISELVTNTTTHQSVRQLAVQLISLLFDTSSSNANIWEVFTAKAGIAGLVALLSSNNTTAQITSANALSSIVVDGPGRARVVEAGGLPALVQSLSSQNINVACAALVTILGLSLEDELCESIVGFGAVTPLLTILAGQEYTTNNIGIDSKLYACEILFNLSCNAQCRPSIVDNKLITQLLDLLFSDQDTYHVVACKTLAVLASDPSTAKSVCEQGGIIGLVPILSQQSADDNTLMSVAVVLTNLARFYEYAKSDIMSTVDSAGENGVSLILHILSTTKNIKIRLQLLDLLQTLAEVPDFTTHIQTNANTIPKLLSLLTTIPEEENHGSDGSTGTSSPINGSTVTDSQNQLLAMFKVLSVVDCVSYNVKTSDMLIDGGCLKHMSSLMTPPPEVLIALDTLSSSSLSLLDLPEKEVTAKPQPKLKIDSIEDKEEINKICLNLINTFSKTEKGKNEIRNANLIQLVQRFLDSKIEDQIKSSLLIISNLSLLNLNRLEINTTGGMDRLLDIFTKTSDPSIILNTIQSLYNLVFLEENFKIFVKRNCFNILSQCISIPNEMVQLRSIQFINRHLNNEKYIESLVSLGVIGKLFSILSTASSETLIFYSLKTINDFIPFDSARTIIHDQLPIDILKTIQSVPQANLQEISKSILLSFGY